MIIGCLRLYYNLELLIVGEEFKFTVFKNGLKVNRLTQLCILIKVSKTLKTFVGHALRSPKVEPVRSRIVN